MVWKPNVTVAAVIEKDGEFLLVEEQVNGKAVLNQPAGHLEDKETLIEAVTRETLEETAWHFLPRHIIGVYRWRLNEEPITYIRFCFSGSVHQYEPARTLDDGIIRAVWMTPDEIARESDRHRSPQVQKCVDDYLAGRCYPLDLITEVS